MAKAFITGPRGSGQLGQGVFSLLITCYFTGSDVSANIDGQAFETVVQLADGYTLADLKNGMVNAAIAKSTELGLTLVASDIDVPSYESGI